MRVRGDRSRSACALVGAALSAGLTLLVAAPAVADFPYPSQSDDYDYSDLRTGQAPDDLGGDNVWKFAATPDPDNDINNRRPTELEGVRGGHVVDEDAPAGSTAWEITTGRPDITIAVLDSGIEWNSVEAMADLRLKTRLNQAEIPVPEGCPDYDCNEDGVVNVADYEGDSRIDLNDRRRVGPAGMMTPQDLLIAFSDGTDADGNGYVDDVVGWDFLDDDNDPFDDVQYGHGTGEAQGSAGESNSDPGGDVGTCPNCMVIHMRVGDSFIADVNRFAEAVIYATDNGAVVIQEALGTLNNSSHARDAVEYAYRHGVTTIASAADEAAQHNNWPSSLPHVILVNSIRKIHLPPRPPQDTSYLGVNGCTNFNSKITLAIPSTSCSSDATAVASGMAGLVYSAAYNANEAGAVDPHPNCKLTTDGPDPGNGLDPCVISANEVRQVMASGTLGGKPFPDDVNFASPQDQPEPFCPAPPPGTPVPASTPGCTDPNGALWAQVDGMRPLVTAGGRSYPARYGHDQFYGYGRVNTRNSVEALVDDPEDPSPAEIPPEVELSTPTWYEQVDPARDSIEVRGDVYARGEQYSCRVFVAPGHYPNNHQTTDVPPGDFEPIPAAGGACDGSNRTDAAGGKLAEINMTRLKSRFPAGTDFAGAEPSASAATGNGRPNPDPHGFVVKVVATIANDAATPQNDELTGEDRRAAFLHRDQDMLTGFPRAITEGGTVGAQPSTPTADGESSPAFADLDGDNRNELVFGTTDGYVHALRPNGSEAPGWPVRSDSPAFVSSHAGSRAYESGEVSAAVGGAILGSVAVADANRDGLPEIYASDLEGKLYGWSHDGTQVLEVEANPAWSGKPLAPFENVRYLPGQSKLRRTQHGFISSPVLADLDGNDGGKLEIVIAGMDRHVYAWERDGTELSGYPLLLVDPAKIQSIDPQTHAVTFRSDAAGRMQGAIIDTPAVGDLDGDANSEGDDELPEIVVGTNEEYTEPLNAGNITTATYPLLASVPGLLAPGNGRLYALKPEGDTDLSSDPLPDEALYSTSWPFKVGIMKTETLPVVGEGISGAPVIAPVTCPSGGAGPKIGVLPNNGPAYVLNPNASSCYGNDPSGKPNALEAEAFQSDEYDHPLLPAVGHPAFGQLTPGAPSFLTPAAGAGRALDIAVPEYQEGQDFVAAWNASTGQFQPDWPVAVNDLQFLTGPSIADIDGAPGEEVVSGTASKDLAAFSAGGTPVNARWPKLTSDWTVANPLIGTFGTFDTEGNETPNPLDGPRKVVVGMTRSGYINAYSTDAPACSPGSWPRFHHDNANSGDMRRDATLPGKPFEPAVAGGALSFNAPGDDLLCGTAASYEAVTSDSPIDESNFAAAQALDGEPNPKAAGASESWTPPASAQRYVAIRAVDDQGNVGRVALFDFRGEPPAGGGPGGGGDPGGSAGGGGEGGGAGGGGGGGGDGEPRPGPAPACSNRIAGTAGDDELVGTSGSDAINGRRGKDLIRARGADDCVRGGPARDRVRGAGGDDTVDGRDGSRDLIRCGPGEDLALVDDEDVTRGCERRREPG